MPCSAAPVETASLTLRTSRASSATVLASHTAQCVDAVRRGALRRAVGFVRKYANLTEEEARLVLGDNLARVMGVT